MDEADMPPVDLDFEKIFAEYGPPDMTPILLRRFAWDTTPCADVNDLLTLLGLTHGSDEGQNADHAESHHRMAAVWPLEQFFRRFSEVLGVVVSTSILQSQGMTLEGDESLKFANQNATIILAAARAMIAQLMFSGMIQYGPAVQVVVMGEADV